MSNRNTFRVTGTQRVEVDITAREIAEALATEVRRLLGVTRMDVADFVTSHNGSGVVLHKPSGMRWTNVKAAVLVDAVNILRYDEVRHFDPAEEPAAVQELVEAASAGAQEALTAE